MPDIHLNLSCLAAYPGRSKCRLRIYQSLSQDAGRTQGPHCIVVCESECECVDVRVSVRVRGLQLSFGAIYVLPYASHPPYGFPNPFLFGKQVISLDMQFFVSFLRSFRSFSCLGTNKTDVTLHRMGSLLSFRYL